MKDKQKKQAGDAPRKKERDGAVAGGGASLLNALSLPDDLAALSVDELERLAAEIRSFLVETVTRTGGHLASNLGVVELTLALFKTFQFPNDQVVWDVGHQSYVHKILSGRLGGFPALRGAGGLSGFPKREESAFDAFDTGHSSTAISAALGMARARDIKRERKRVIAVVGDGALTGGMCYEAMNDAGRSKTDLLVVLNDNNMSISGNVGGVSEHLSKIRSAPAYMRLRDDIRNTIQRTPFVGEPLASLISTFKEKLKYALIPGVIFEELGFSYIGPVDGHDVAGLLRIFSGVKDRKGPTLVHVVTKKGMGYALAESNPQKFHGVSVRHPASESGRLQPVASFSDAFGGAAVSLARNDASLVAVCAAMASGTGLERFARDYPSRFFDVGIAEQHAVTLSAGMALNGLRPVVAIYSTFLQRAYDQILHDVCLQNAHVVFAVDRAGAVGEDGETHQGLFDIAFLRGMPNMTVLAPSGAGELRRMLEYALYEEKGPVAIRYPKAAREAELGFRFAALRRGKSEVLQPGTNVSIVAAGAMLPAAAEAADALAEQGVSAELVTARFLQPLDEAALCATARKTGRVLVVEDGIAAGGYGSAVLEALARAGVLCRATVLGFPSVPIAQGTRAEQLSRYGLDAEGIFAAALALAKTGDVPADANRPMRVAHRASLPGGSRRSARG